MKEGKKATPRQICEIVADAIRKAKPVVDAVQLVNSFDAYVPPYQLDGMSVPQAIEGLERRRDERVEVKKVMTNIQRNQLTKADYKRLNHIEGESRASGGGRKRKHDLDGKQVEALLKFAEKNGHAVPTNADALNIIRKGGSYQSPYTNTRSLISAARRKLGLK